MFRSAGKRYLSTTGISTESRVTFMDHSIPFPVKKTPASIKPPPVYRNPTLLSEQEKKDIQEKRKSDPEKYTVTKLAKTFQLHKRAVMTLAPAPPSRHQQLREEWERKHRKVDLEAWAEKCRQAEKERAAAIKASNIEWHATQQEQKRKNLDPRVIFAPDFLTPKGEVRRRDKL